MWREVKTTSAAAAQSDDAAPTPQLPWRARQCVRVLRDTEFRVAAKPDRLFEVFVVGIAKQMLQQLRGTEAEHK